jgi:hypothetical protein
MDVKTELTAPVTGPCDLVLAGQQCGRRQGTWRRLIVGVVSLLVAITGLSVAVATPALANATVYVGGSGVAVRDCYHPYKQQYPSTSCTYQASLEAHLTVRLVCQTAGQGVGSGNDYYWDYILYPATANHGSGEGYASDWYINTNIYNYPYRDYDVPLCNY